MIIVYKISKIIIYVTYLDIYLQAYLFSLKDLTDSQKFEKLLKERWSNLDRTI